MAEPLPNTKCCLRCNRILPCFSTGRDSAFKGGKATICRNCEMISKFDKYETDVSLKSKGETKVCSCCRKTKVIELFDNKSKDSDSCQRCYKKVDRVVIHNPKDTATCKECDEVLPLCEFRTNKRLAAGYMQPCKVCHNEIEQGKRDKLRERTPDQINAAMLERHRNRNKKCCSCKEDREFHHFHPNPGRIDGLDTQCRYCKSADGAAKVVAMNERSYEEMFADTRRTVSIPDNVSFEEYKHECCNCHKYKGLDEFSFIGNKVSVIYGVCYECIIKNGQEKAKEAKELRDDLKKDGCIICLETDPRVIDLAHMNRSDKYRNINGKTEQPSHLSVARLEEESEFLVPICSNDHRRITFAENYHSAEYNRDKPRVLLDIINEEKMRHGCCARCKKVTIATDPEYNLMMFDFDHLPGQHKINEVSYMVSRNYPQEVVRTEMKKCQLLCSNCHRIITHERVEIYGHGLVRNRQSVLYNYRLYQAGQTHKHFKEIEERAPRPERPDTPGELAVKAHLQFYIDKRFGPRS